jgi:OmpA-OmpF porin, OOP family
MRLVLVFTLLFLHTFLDAQVISNESFNTINSHYDEKNPVLTPDGKTLYFTIANHPSNIGGKRDPGDIWMATWQGDKWSSPVHCGPKLNDRAYNAVAGFSRDGMQLFLLSHYDASGNMPRTQGIAVSRKTEEGWTFPENIVIPYFQNRSTFLCGTLSDDLKVFIFSAETYGTYGVDDLYLSTYENGKWSEPQNLGGNINTQYQEVSPSLSPDGTTLYFSSNGRKGNGSFDVYSASRLDETWTNWSIPVNMGTAINTEGRELFYRDYAHLGVCLLTSTKDSDGYGTLRLSRYREPVAQEPIVQEPVVKADSVFTMVTQPDTLSADISSRPVVEERRPALVKIYGKVTNTKTGEAIDATLSFAAASLQERKAETTTASGYEIEIPSTQSYSIKIEAAGYVSVLEKLDVNSYEMRELEMNFSLQPVEIGTKVNLKNVLFVQTKTELLPESYDELDMVVSFLKRNPNVKIELSGHTDNRGVHGDNMRLSQLRVNSVKRYLVSKGIDAKRITGRGYGGTKPIASNDSEETRQLNRRVEFTIKKF